MATAREGIHQHLKVLWDSLYCNNENYKQSLQLLDEFMDTIDSARRHITCHKETQEANVERELFQKKKEDWYQTAIVYCLYVDLFNSDFEGLSQKLPYLKDFGVTCLWLLPMLDSPMKDCGFDIRDYYKIRRELLPESVRDAPIEEQIKCFRDFMSKAHAHGINVLIDIALNHTSEETEWFKKEKQEKADGASILPEDDYYIWSENPNRYPDVRIIFSDVCESNWEPVYGDSTEQKYYFHRFLANQPDLNYKNPKVLLQIADSFVFWLKQGVDAFRMDAIPMLWKQDETDCESLPQVHTVLKFFRSLIDYVSPNTMILAEACQQPKQVVQYFGNNDECHAAYHFPLIPRLFHSMAIQNKSPVQDVLSPDVTPDIPSHCAWFMFLRCHDELTIEMVPPNERKQIFDFYCRDEKWQFRQHCGVSARLADLLNYNPDLIRMAHSLLMSIIGTPIMFYGDEFAMTNDDDYYEEALKISGIYDTRNYNRGRLNNKWSHFEEKLEDKNSLTSLVHFDLKNKIKVRRQFDWLGKNLNVNVINVRDVHDQVCDHILAYERKSKDGELLLFVHNLKDAHTSFKMNHSISSQADLLGAEIDVQGDVYSLNAYGHLWLKIN